MSSVPTQLLFPIASTSSSGGVSSILTVIDKLLSFPNSSKAVQSILSSPSPNTVVSLIFLLITRP